MDMPSLEEQKIAEEYVLKKPMDRPDTDAKKAIKYIAIYIAVSIVFGVASLILFKWLGFFSFISTDVEVFMTKHPFWFTVLYLILIFILIGVCCLKSAVIGCIKLYQHYAPEDIRRRCLFKPTCSEYAIMAIKKYGLIIGLIKKYIRLFWKCRGNVYSIDYP